MRTRWRTSLRAAPAARSPADTTPINSSTDRAKAISMRFPLVLTAVGAAAVMVPLLTSGAAAVPGANPNPTSSGAMIQLVQGGAPGQGARPPAGPGGGGGAGRATGAVRTPSGPPPSGGLPAARSPGAGPGSFGQAPRDGRGSAGPAPRGPGRADRIEREGRGGLPREGRGPRDGLGRDGASAGDGSRASSPRRDAQGPRGRWSERGDRRSERRFDRQRERWYSGPGPRGARDGRRSGIRYSWGPGIVFYYRDGWYYGDCRWLRRRAIETGRPIWWQRYRRCRASGL